MTWRLLATWTWGTLQGYRAGTWIQNWRSQRYNESNPASADRAVAHRDSSSLLSLSWIGGGTWDLGLFPSWGWSGRCAFGLACRGPMTSRVAWLCRVVLVVENLVEQCQDLLSASRSELSFQRQLRHRCGASFLQPVSAWTAGNHRTQARAGSDRGHRD